jgi:hypothetical protein
MHVYGIRDISVLVKAWDSFYRGDASESWAKNVNLWGNLT